jgi:hypothetical protein
VPFERTYTASGGNIYQQAQEVVHPSLAVGRMIMFSVRWTELEKYPAATPN